MINGDWLWSEVERYSQVVELDFRFMRTPINSAIIDKLATVNSEEQLVECVKYIDTVLDGTSGTRPAYLSDADYDRLLEARRMVRSTHTQQSSFVPSTSRAWMKAMRLPKCRARSESVLTGFTGLTGLSGFVNISLKFAWQKVTAFEVEGYMA